MKQFSENFQNHINGEALSLCNCWRIIRADGTVLGFTDHDRDISFGGVVHEASSGFDASQVEENARINVDSHDLVGALQSDKISEADIKAQLYDGARIEHHIVNWSTPEESALMRTMLLGEISQQDHLFRAEARSLSALLDQTQFRRFEKTCSANFGDGHCGIDLNLWQTMCKIERIITPQMIAVSGIDSFAAGWFRAGRAVLSLASAVGPGAVFEIAEHLSPAHSGGHANLRLWSAIPDSVKPGDELVLTPGCNKQFATCRDRFANSINFKGFPHMPGPDFATSFAANADTMDGSPLVR